MEQTKYQYKYLLFLITGEKKEYISDLSPSDLFISKDKGLYTLIGEGKTLHEGCFHFELVEEFTIEIEVSVNELIHDLQIECISMAFLNLIVILAFGSLGLICGDFFIGKLLICLSAWGIIGVICYYIYKYKQESANLKKQEHNNI